MGGLLAACAAVGLMAIEVDGQPLAEDSTVHFAGIPRQKPEDRPLSAAVQRLYDQWSPLADFDNEFYTLFKYSRIDGIGKDPLVSRRDPSKVIHRDGVYHVWYTRRQTEKPPVGLSNYTDDMPDDVPAWDWDLADIYHATSTDGFTWTERGVAVGRNIGGEYADRSLSTPDILYVNDRYYLYYQAFTGRFSQKTGDRCDVTMAWADSPDGPWHPVNRPVIELGESDQWDGTSIHDPYPLIYQGRIWLYYKSDVWLQDARGESVAQVRHDGSNARDIHRMHGVAIAAQPEGPFTKSPLNPITNSGHETTLFPYREGIAALIIKDGPEKNTVQYAPDGLNFSVQAHIVQPPVAGGPFCADAFTDTGDGRGITWGLCHIVGSGNGFLLRFDCDLSRDIDRPWLKRGTVQADETGHFQWATTLPERLRTQAAREAAETREETGSVRLGPAG